MKKKRFHQFIILEKGIVNTAIIDFLKGDVFQVKNEIIDKFERGMYSEISEFINYCETEELVIEVKEKNCVDIVTVLDWILSRCLTV